jgi:hypothetical protein
MTDAPARAWHRTMVIKPLAGLFTDSGTRTDFGRTDNNTYIYIYIFFSPGKCSINTMHSEYHFIRRMHRRRLSRFFLFVYVLFVHRSVLKGSGDGILFPELLGIRTFPAITYSNRNTASRKLNLVEFYFPKSCIFLIQDDGIMSDTT